MNDLAKQLGKRIYLFRKENKLTQAALAEKAKISNEFMSAMERGARLPSLLTLERIAEVLKVGLKDLFNFDRAAFRQIQSVSRESFELGSIIDRVPPDRRRRIAKVVKILSQPGDG